MPRQGYKTITVKEEVYDFFKKAYDEQKNELALQGITSFSAYCTKMLYEMIQREKQRSKSQ